MASIAPYITVGGVRCRFMVMRISLGSADVDAGAAGRYEKVHVETRGDRLRARTRQGDVVLDVEATAVRRLANRAFEADVVIDGEQQVVTFKRAGCGCGG